MKRSRPSRIANTLTWWLPAVLAGALQGCGAERSAPVTNPAPTSVLQVFGAIDPDLTLAVSTQYLATSADCRDAPRMLDRLNGADALPQAMWVDSPVTRTGDTYAATIAFDQFRDDGCGWYPFAIGFHVTAPQGLSTGHFSTGAAGTRHAPGPEARVWISTRGKGLAATDPARPIGAAAIRPLDLNCGENILRGVRALSCVTNSPRELPLISEDADEVQVNFRHVTTTP